MNRLLPWTYRLAALLFGGVFVYAAALKLEDPLLFQKSIETFDLLPDYGTAALALGLPWLELLAGLAVITGVMRNGGLLLLNVSLVTFFIAIGSAKYRGLNIDCGCFGGSHNSTNYTELFIRDGLLLALGLWLQWLEHRSAKQAPTVSP